MMGLIHHVIIEPLWSCHLIHLPVALTFLIPLNKSHPHFAVENNHPLVPIVTISYHITYKSRHSYHLPIPKHPQFRAAEIQKCILGVVAFFVRGYQVKTCVRFFLIIVVAARQTALWWCFVFHASFHLHLNFFRLLLPPPPPHAIKFIAEFTTLGMLFVFGIIRIIARCRLFFFTSLSSQPLFPQSSPPDTR